MRMHLPLAGIPSWVEDRRDHAKGERFNNHNWVEVWDGAAWSFTGERPRAPPPRGSRHGAAGRPR